MPISEYEKMPKDFKKLNLDEKSLQEINKLKWIVTEKIHGANFSFIYESRNLKFAKRKELLQWTDDFFGFQLVVNKIEDQIIKVFENLSQDLAAERYVIYGELFGGYYPHPDVPSNPNVQAIQTGVYYSPDINFCGFDIAVENEDKKYYLDYDKAIQYFTKHNVLHAAPLFTGKLNEALQFNIRTDSRMPKTLGLPSLENNLIEGVVIKPLNHSRTSLAENRPILKVKNPEFDEEEKFHEAEKWSYRPEISSKSESLAFLVDELKKYINENRLNSAVSKIGKLDLKNDKRLRSIQEEIVNDALTDFNENNNNILKDLTADESQWINDRLQFEVVRFMTSKK